MFRPTCNKDSFVKEIKKNYIEIQCYLSNYSTKPTYFPTLTNTFDILCRGKQHFTEKSFFFYIKVNYFCQDATYVYIIFKQYAEQITIKTDTMTVALFSSLICHLNFVSFQFDLSIILMSWLMSFLYWQINISYIIPRVSEFKICVELQYFTQLILVCQKS